MKQQQLISAELQHYMDAYYPIIYLNTYEEGLAREAVTAIVGSRKGYIWDVTQGLANLKTGDPEFTHAMSLDESLALLADSHDETVLLIQDAHRHLDDPRVIRWLITLAMRITSGFESTIFLVSPIVKLPVELEKFITVIELGYPSQDDVIEVITKCITENESHIPSEDDMRLLARACSGLTRFEVDNILALTLASGYTLDASCVSFVNDEKSRAIKRSEVLEIIKGAQQLSAIGGLDNLKLWLQGKAKIFHDLDRARAYGVDVPKGVLVAGMPGCGKSLCAKATASCFGVPLLRLDIGKLMGKYVGESEENMRRALALAEANSPCVLWIDELEKAFAGINSSTGGDKGGGGSEVATRMFGYFLTWMQEKSGSTFVIATANNIKGLPPELLRRGRFDEIFYVGLPFEKEREQILRIHLGNRRRDDASAIDFALIAKQTDGYSGADLESVIRDAIEYAFLRQRPSVCTDDLVHAKKEITSISVVMGEQLKSLEEGMKDFKLKPASCK